MMRKVVLGDVVKINPAMKVAKGQLVKFISMDRLDPFTKTPNGYEKKKFSSGTKFANGDTLLARITPCLENGKTAFVDFLDDSEVAAGSTEFVILRNIKGLTDPAYIYYLSISPAFRDYAIKSMVGTSGRQRVQNDVLAKMELSLPPLYQQKKIADILSSLDEKIELNRRMNEALEQLGQALFRHYFVDNPAAKSWDKKPLDETANFLNGLAMQKYPKINGQPTLPVIKIREMSSGITDSTDIASANIPEEYIVRDGDLLFSWSGTLMVKFWSGGDGALNQHLFKVTSDKYPEWLYYYWAKYRLDHFVSIAKSKATTMGYIQRKHLKQAEVIVPPNIEEMTLELALIIDQLKVNLSEINSLINLRDSLLPKLISGEIEV